MAVRTLKVVIDNREKRPIRFPVYIRRDGDLLNVETVSRHLRTGDYRLDNKGFAKVLIERKGRPQELYDCTLGSRRKQFRNQLHRLAMESDFPTLLLDSAPHEVETYDFSQFNRWAKPDDGERVVEILMDLCMEYTVHLIWFGRVETPVREWSCGRLVLYLLTTKMPQVA